MILTVFPNLIRLEVRDSTLPSLSNVAGVGLSVVENVNLSGCSLSSWEEVAWLCSVPNLATLKLCFNPLSAIPTPLSEPFFPQLRMLNLEETALDSLVHLSNLDTFPNLTDLRLTKTPLAYRFGEAFRMMVIAHLPKVWHLNGGEVDLEERVSLERNFVREFARESGAEEHYREGEREGLAGMLLPEEYPVNSSTFTRLFSAHGPVHKFASVDLTPPTSLSLTLQHSSGSHTLSVPYTLTVAELLEICHDHFQIPLEKLHLFKKLNALYKTKLEPDGALLSSFRLADGDTVVVEKEKPEPRARLMRRK